jgi:FkbM family methyltransferase
MDTIRLIVRLIHMIPSNRLTARVVDRIIACMPVPEGPVLTGYNYFIDYKNTGPMNGVRRSVIAGYYEREDFEMIKRLVNPGDTVIDVGANEGYVSLWLSKLLGAKGVVYAIEPNPENLVFLYNNIKLNTATNIRVIEKAVSDQKAKMTFFCSPNSGAWGSLTKYSYFSEDCTDVEVDILDNLFGDLQQLDFLKVDTEGNELKVFLGARLVLSRHKPHICFEVNLTFWAQNNQSVDEMFNCLYDLGYKLFILNGHHLRPYEWLNARIVNLFAIHTSRIFELEGRNIITALAQ